jgi:hypothetical protein
MKPGSAVEMPGGGKPGKPKPGFPRFPPPLEIAARFPHFHRANDVFPAKTEPKNQRKETGIRPA